MPKVFREFLDTLNEEQAKELVQWVDETSGSHIWLSVCEVLYARFPNVAW